MSVNLQQITTATDTFGVWVSRTNEIIEALEDVVSLGSTTAANANGNVVINGFIRASEGIQADTIDTISGGGNLTIDTNLVTRGNLTIDNDNLGQPTQISMQDGGSSVWRIRSNNGATVFDIETVDNSHTLRLNTDSNLIQAVGMTIDPTIVTNLPASAVTSGTFSTARIPSLTASRISSGVFDEARIPTLPASRISQGDFTGDYRINTGSLEISNNDDGTELLRLTDNSAASNNKVMMTIAGQSSDLEIINWDDQGDYLIVAGDTGFMIHDQSVGFHILHRSATDPNGFNHPIKSGLYPTNGGPFFVSELSGTVSVVANAPTQVRNTLRVDGDVILNGGTIRGRGAVPVGAVQGFLSRSAPAGWLVLNGAAIPNGVGTVQGITADYSDLYALLVSVYGSNGGSDINLPDMRGFFTRAWDDSTGSLTGDIGQPQLDQIQDHQHDLSPFAILDDSGTSQPGQNATSDADRSTETGPVLVGSARVGDETRPRNIALLYCIKY